MRAAPVLRRVRSHTPPFRVGPWDPGDGDPGRPHAVSGAAVATILRVRRGGRGVLAQLEDGRFAVSDPRVAAAGGSSHLFRYCRSRIARATTEEEQAWWQEVAGAISQNSVRGARATRRRFSVAESLPRLRA